MIDEYPSEPTGNTPLAQWLRRLVRAGRANRLLPGVGYRVKPGNSGKFLELASRGAQEQPKTYRLKSVQHDYVTCHLITSDGETVTEDTTADYYIAKPWSLRCLLTSGYKYGLEHTYTYSDDVGWSGTATPDSFNLVRKDDWGTSNEEQLVTPPWAQDDEITAVEGYTTVFTEAETPVRVTLVMLSPFRQWAKIKDPPP